MEGKVSDVLAEEFGVKGSKIIVDGGGKFSRDIPIEDINNGATVGEVMRKGDEGIGEV
jgi:hypothetical protein